jgi:hypothetical protein
VREAGLSRERQSGNFLLSWNLNYSLCILIIELAFYIDMAYSNWLIGLLQDIVGFSITADMPPLKIYMNDLFNYSRNGLEENFLLLSLSLNRVFFFFSFFL